MSCVFFVTPIIASWPLFTTVAASIAGSLGYKILSGTQANTTDAVNSVEVEVDNNKLLQELLDSKEGFSLTKEGITITFEKDMRGYCKVCASGSACSEEQLKKTGKEIFNRVMQEYSYSKVKEELKAKGFTVTEEKVDDQGTIQIQVRKWS